jgi:hypothetical protein
MLTNMLANMQGNLLNNLLEDESSYNYHDLEKAAVEVQLSFQPPPAATVLL